MAKGRKTGGGSRKGKPNKGTQELREMILGALEAEGGIEYLRKQAKETPAAFMTLIGKVLPTKVEGDLNHTGNVTITMGFGQGSGDG